MKNTFALIAILSALTLTACGGGGGSSDKPNQSPVSVNQPIDPNKPSAKELEGGIFWDNKSAIKNLDPNNKTWKIINIYDEIGYDLVILPDNAGNSIYDKTMAYDKDMQVRRLVGANLSYARWGIISFSWKNGDFFNVHFYKGEPTDKKEVPTTGTAVYQGYAIASVHDSNQQYNDKMDFYKIVETDTGTSTVNVDFAKKTVDVSITLNKAGKLSFDVAKITDDGKATYSNMANDNSFSIAGVFYGPKAVETAGSFFSNDKKGKVYIGNFGAKKQ